ncbi:MAG TPA: glycosyltransferase [Mycobacteriales bacterium]|nr:glycosyltransferase [Mycobacteriales bacterium]
MSRRLDGGSLRVILVNYRCLDGIAEHLRSPVFHDCDVILVDNASDPQQVAELARSTGARALYMDRNVGFAAAVNAAARLPAREGSAHSATLLLNPDVEIDEQQLAALLRHLQQSDADAVGPVLVDEHGRVWVSSAGGPITLRSVAWYFLFLSHLVPRLSGFFWTRRQVTRGPVEVPRWLCGACLLVRADAFERFGYLPTDEIVYGEDVGWGVAATARGARLVLARDVVVRHVGGQSGGSDAWVDATIRTMRRHLGPVRGPVASLVVRAGLGLRRIAHRVRG